MEPKVVWLFIFVALYWAYCIYWGIKGAQSAKTASDYFIAGRGISLWVFVLAATATSFSGWTFIGHPGLEYRDGFPYAFASFYAITIPLTGVLFLKRQWILGKHYGFVTPGEMLSEYFRGDAIRLLTVVVALCFSVPYLGLQLRASGFLFNVLTDGWLGVDAGMWLLSAVVLIYVASGGLRAVAYVDTLQCLLLALGIVVVGLIALHAVGGWGRFTDGIAALSSIDAKRTPAGYSHYVAVPGAIQMVGDGPSAEGGAWTGTMIMTYMFALMGIQAAPAFTMWAFANRDPRPFAPQQVWASAFGIGAILFFFTTIQGLGGHFLGADAAFAERFPELTNNVLGPALEGRDLMATKGKQEMLVPMLIELMSTRAPWVVGLLAVCALAAMQSTGAAYMSTAGGMLTRDLLKHFVMPNASHAVQKLAGRIGVSLVAIAALAVASSADDALVLLGGLAVAFGFQMFPALIAVCYVSWFTRAGITWGLLVGILAVIATESTGQALGVTGWGRWPLTLHSAFWGIALNFAVAIAVSAFTQRREETEHRQRFHRFLRASASVPQRKRALIPIAWIAVLMWFFFAIGPGAVIGNTLFGDPNSPETWWVFGMPSVWVWQIAWWVLGVAMMWFLAYRLEMSTMPHGRITAILEDIGDLGEDEDRLEHVPAE